ncbi:hypothetical protein MAHJHV54_47370 [Mycobacterium avium subsp. hominissuis]
MRDAGNAAADVGRTISRIAHQIIEKTALDGPDGPVLPAAPMRNLTSCSASPDGSLKDVDCTAA